jgi:hypothetical protein
MKFRSKLLWQKSFAVFALFALLSISTFAQTAATVAVPVREGSLSKTEAELTGNIKIDSIKSYTNALSADEMEGRGTMQPGGEKAANWIAEKFKSLGLKPLGDKGSYLQSIKFKEAVFTPETSFKLGEESLKLGMDYGIAGFSVNEGSVSGDMVFVAYGIVADSIKRNDLKGVNVTGKIVVMLQGPPANIPKKAWEDQKASRIFIGGLIRQGAKAIVFIGHGREEQPPETLLDYFSRRQVSMAGEDRSPAVPIPFIYASNKAAEKMFAKSSVSYKDALQQAESNDFKPFELKQKGKITMKTASTKGTSNNVVGYIEGSDPTLKEEAVLFSAHYDAYGVENGKIYNGAADNALGTAEMLAVAEAYSKMEPRPKRSMIFLAVTGEEYGLYGSKYWANNPTWDIKKVSANLNLDGIGTEVYGPVKNMVGFGAEYSTLGSMLDDVAYSYGIKIMPDPQPEEKVFTRSDHYSFVERGVPALMLMGAPEGTPESLVEKIKAWEKVNYHQPTDDIMENWDWSGAKTVADMMGVLGLRISNQEKMPEWIKGTRFGELKRGNTKDLPEEK